MNRGRHFTPCVREAVWEVTEYYGGNLLTTSTLCTQHARLREVPGRNVRLKRLDTRPRGAGAGRV